MEHIIEAVERKTGIKSALKQLRRDGNIPAVVYGNGQKPVSISINAKSFRNQFSHISESMLIILKIEGHQDKSVLIKDFVQNLVRENIVHIDFYEVSYGKTLTTNLLLSTKGSSEGVRLGGVLEHFMHEIEIECLPKDLPEELFIDITELNIGDSVLVSDLPALQGVEYMAEPDQMIINVSAPKQASLEADLDDGIEDEEDAVEEDEKEDKEK